MRLADVDGWGAAKWVWLRSHSVAFDMQSFGLQSEDKRTAESQQEHSMIGASYYLQPGTQWCLALSLLGGLAKRSLQRGAEKAGARPSKAQSLSYSHTWRFMGSYK